MRAAQASSAPSPKRPFSAISTNHRRPQPAESVSLPRHKKPRVEAAGEDAVEAPGRPNVAATPTVRVHDSNDSSSDQSAAKWFDRVNENVGDSRQKLEKHGNESPFYMSHQANYVPPANAPSLNVKSFGQRARDDTENDELRGVIDDLTVENKRLKGLLKNWQSRSSPTGSGPDRIVEVRMHGLPAEKKRELEQLLKSFATNINGEPPSHPTSTTPADRSLPSTETSVLTVPKHGADLNVTDSGYASLSNSGLNSQSGAARLREPVSKSKKAKDIKNYLHDIPDSLFPQHGSVSGQAKMSLIVQRLEQLFTGRTAAPGEHSLPLQQQKISRSAARADRLEDEKHNRASKIEGSREAHILPPDSKDNLDAPDQGAARGSRGTQSASGGDGSSTEAPGGHTTPEQRPTRPLDLDIQRAQVAADNVSYIRHLGLSSPHFEDDSDSPDQPWMYLNLLANMAQLHTLNVTPALVRKAVKRHSTKFELSKDGHKIRWKKGATHTPSTAQQESPLRASHRVADDAGDDGGRQSGRSATSTLNDHASMSVSDDRAIRVASSTSRLVNSTTTSSNPAAKQPSSRSNPSAFDYKPIVYHGKKSSLKASISYLDSSSSYEDASPPSSGLANAMSRSTLKSKDEAHEGLMTFFSNPNYITDLSGDRSPISVWGALYTSSTGVLGVPQQNEFENDDLRDASSCYYASGRDMGSDRPAPSVGDLDLCLDSMLSAGEKETQPLELPASGIGGVRPEDNFALDVKVLRWKQRRIEARHLGRQRIRRVLNYSYRTQACDRLALQPSRLPPPSYVFFTSSSSSVGDKGYFYDDTNSETSDADESAAPAGLLWQWSSSSNERPMGDDDSDGSSLGGDEAPHARLANPRVAAVPDRGFIVHPASRNMSGSLAATVGASNKSAASLAEPDGDRGYEDSTADMSVDESDF